MVQAIGLSVRNETVKKITTGFIEKFQKFLVEQIQKGIEEGSIKSTHSPTEAAMCVRGLLWIHAIAACLQRLDLTPPSDTIGCLNLLMKELKAENS